MKTIFSIYSVLILFTAFLLADGIRVPSAVRFTHLTPNEGLSTNMITCIAQDRDGFIWVGTRYGLNRYDGYEFKGYLHDPDSQKYTGANTITALHLDGRKHLWIGTNGSGLYEYDPIHDKVQHREPNIIGSDVIDRFFITAIQHDHDNQLWIGTLHQGLFRFQPETNTAVCFKNIAGNSNGIADDHITALAVTPDNQVWIGTNTMGLYGYDQAADRLQHYHPNSENPNHQVSFMIQGLRTDRQDPAKLWIATFFDGLCMMNTDEDIITSYRDYGSDEMIVPLNHFFDIDQDRSGKIWLPNPVGLTLFDPAEESFAVFQNATEDPRSLSGTSASCVFADQQNIVWVGTHNSGLNKYDRTVNRFGFYGFNSGITDDFLIQRITGIQEDSDGNLWFASNGNGTLHLDLEKRSLAVYQTDDTAPDAYSNHYPLSVQVGSDGMVWTGSYIAGLFSMNPKTGDITNWHADIHNPESLSNDIVYSILEDSQGAIWIGTDHGLNRFDRLTESFRRFYQDPDSDNSLSGDKVYALLEDDSLNIWIGLQDGTLCQYLPKHDLIIRHRDETGNGPVHCREVLDLCQDSKGVIWIGTRGNGLKSFHPGTGLFQSFTTEDGLPSNVINGILEDSHGRLWLSTVRGICSIQPESGSVRTFTVADGLQANEFLFGSRLKTTDGEMLFGGPRGISFFHPDSIRNNSHVPELIIADLKINYQSITQLPQSRREKIIDQSVNSASEIYMTWRDRVFSFHFAALNFSNPVQNRYAYRLAGYQDDWVQCGGQRQAQFMNIPPGSYIFQVRGSNNDGIWNDTGKSVRVIIRPPFWNTVWFKTVSVVLLITAVTALLRLRIRAYKRQSIRLEQDVAQRTVELSEEIVQRKKAEKEAVRANQAKSDFLAGISHEIRTPLNAVLGFSELLSTEVRDHRHQSYLHSIHTAGKNLLALINNILDLAKIEAGRMVSTPGPVLIKSFVRDAMAVFQNAAQKKGLQSEVIIKDTVPDAVITDELWLRQIIFNLVGNAVKFTEQGRIELITDVVEKTDSDRIHLKLAVRDTGIGIPQHQQEHIFDSFNQVRSRSRLPTGTGLGLTLSRRMTELMGGTLTVSSQPDQGSIFTVDIPVIPIASDLEMNAGLETRAAVSRYAGGHVLIADDDESNRFLLRELLLRAGLTVLEAEGGTEAVRIAASQAVDLILMDIHMPDFDGIDAITEIRKNPRYRFAPAYAVTASSMSGTREKIKKSGLFQGLLTKPVSISHLNLILQKHFEEVPVPETGSDDGKDSKITETGSQGNNENDLLPKNLLVQWKHVRDLGSVEEIGEFGQMITDHGRKSGNPVLTDFGSRLAELTESFDADRIYRHLDQFPQFFPNQSNTREDR